MPTDYGQHFSTKSTPQTDPAHPDQRRNNAGGFSFVVDRWDRLDRFLVLGAEGGTYYVAERELTRDNAQCVLECLAEDGPRAVARIAATSVSGRAPKNDAAIFALAMAAGDPKPETRRVALAALPDVCRTGTHLLHFARDAEKFRRWGRSLRRAVAAWYASKTPAQVAYQVAKYGQRDGWSHRDLLRLSHPVAPTPGHAAVFRWVATKGAAPVAPAPAEVLTDDRAREVRFGSRTLTHRLGLGSSPDRTRVRQYPAVDPAQLPPILDAVEQALDPTTPPAVVCRLVRDHNLTHEMVHGDAKRDRAVWEALLMSAMPLGAMVRNLGKMTAVGLVAPGSAAARHVADRLGDGDAIRRQRLHPVATLLAMHVYAQGHGEKGKLTWDPAREVVDALDGAFYAGFAAVEPSGARTLLAIDVSGSMDGNRIAGTCIDARAGSAAMAMVTARAERTWTAVGFSDALRPLAISPRQRMDDVVRVLQSMPMGRTDCSAPMQYAERAKLEVDAFVVYTDNETYMGNPHPHQALAQYRQRTGIAAKLVVVGMTSTQFTIADPTDAGMLDVVGFDAAAPGVIADFCRPRARPAA